MRVTIKALTAVLLIGAFVAVSRADTVRLRCGEVFEGEVVEHAERIEVRVGWGSIFVSRREVTCIIRAGRRVTFSDTVAVAASRRGAGRSGADATSLSYVVERRLRTISEDDMESLERLLEFCRRRSLTVCEGEVRARLKSAARRRFKALASRVRTAEQAAALLAFCRRYGLTEETSYARSLYFRLRVEAALCVVDGADPGEVVDLALSLDAEGVPPEHLKILFGLAVSLDGVRAAAAAELGCALVICRWLPRERAALLLERLGRPTRRERGLRRREAAVRERERRVCERERRVSEARRCDAAEVTPLRERSVRRCRDAAHRVRGRSRVRR